MLPLVVATWFSGGGTSEDMEEDIDAESEIWEEERRGILLLLLVAADFEDRRDIEDFGGGGGGGCLHTTTSPSSMHLKDIPSEQCSWRGRGAGREAGRENKNGRGEY